MSGLIRGNRVNLPGVTIGGGDGIGGEFLGTIGPIGPQGLQGSKGDTGATGPQGSKGDTGATGPQGSKGDTGAAGPTGLAGDTGAAGPQGSKGDTGAMGPQGSKGDTGAMGPAGPSVFSGLYPFPISIRNSMISPGSKTYITTYTMLVSTTFTSVSNFFEGPTSDQYRVAIYRGDLSNATLVAQTNNLAPTSGYNTKLFTLSSGQNLSFTIGSQISIAYTISGATTSHPNYTGVSNAALATISSTKYTDGFPAAITGIASQSATTVRICMELS